MNVNQSKFSVKLNAGAAIESRLSICGYSDASKRLIMSVKCSLCYFFRFFAASLSLPNDFASILIHNPFAWSQASSIQVGFAKNEIQQYFSNNSVIFGKWLAIFGQILNPFAWLQASNSGP